MKTLFLVLLFGFTASCVAIQRDGNAYNNSDASVTQESDQNYKSCSKTSLVPHQVCIYIGDILMMTSVPDGGPCNGGDGWCDVPPEQTINLPEPCWNNPSCECLQANGVVACPVAETKCENHPENSQYPLACGCVGSCCQHTQDGYSRWTCSCVNLDGSPWCMNTGYPQVCVDTLDDGAICQSINR